MELLIALVLAGAMGGESVAVEKYDPWLAASNDGSLLATAQVCEFDQTELQQVVEAMEHEGIQLAAQNRIAFDSAAYQEAFLDGNAKMHSLLNLVLPQQTEAQKQQACAEVRIQWDRLRQTLSPLEASNSP